MTTFVLPDPSRRLASVRLAQEIGLSCVDFTYSSGAWTLSIGDPPVDRMEYLFELEDHNGRRWTVTDPANPLRAPGAFGEKSVLEFAGYASPSWLSLEVDEGTRTEHRGATVWAPSSLPATAPAPLVLVHDGPEYDALGSFTRYIAALDVSARVALLHPGDRNPSYSANPSYAAGLADLVPTLAPATVRIGVGVSLGALAMLHFQRRFPHLVDGLFLQSGSFFTPDLDPQESDFAHFAEITAFVASVRGDGCPAVLTCGTVEENLANNAAMAATLAAPLYERRDAHNYTAWRDALQPRLGELIVDASTA